MKKFKIRCKGNANHIYDLLRSKSELNQTFIIITKQLVYDLFFFSFPGANSNIEIEKLQRTGGGKGYCEAKG